MSEIEELRAALADPNNHELIADWLPFRKSPDYRKPFHQIATEKLEYWLNEDWVHRKIKLAMVKELDRRTTVNKVKTKADDIETPQFNYPSKEAVAKFVAERERMAKELRERLKQEQEQNQKQSV